MITLLISGMTNKQVVQFYMQSFSEGNHSRILSCLCDDIIWTMPGFFKKIGKSEFDSEIENDNFTGKPDITVNRLTEENDVVIAEGRVVAQMKNGETLDAVFCDVFVFENGKIKQLTSYVMNSRGASLL